MKRDIYWEIAEYSRKKGLLEQGDKIVAGVSGGADSIFLLQALWKLREMFGLQIAAVHVHHGIRGEEADRDRQYTEEFAGRLGLQCVVFEEKAAQAAKEWNMSLEEAGRVLRYRRFEQVREQLGFDKIAVAHHRDDQAETVLLQILRGSGLKGLGGMRPRRERIIRPLLFLSRAEIEAALEQEDIRYCNDSTNQLDDHTRNKLRNRVLPYLQKEVQPAAAAHLAALGERMQGIWDYMEEQCAEFCDKNTERKQGIVQISCEEMQKLPESMQAEVLLRLFGEIAGQRKDFTERHVLSVIRLLHGGTGKKVMLPYHLTAEKSYNTLILKENPDASGRKGKGQRDVAGVQEDQAASGIAGVQEDWTASGGAGVQEDRTAPDSAGVQEDQTASGIAGVQPGQTIHLPVAGEIWEISFELSGREKISEDDLKKNCTKCFDYDKMGTMPVFRYPMPGDYLWLDAEGRKKKLSRFFIDAKIPPADRKQTAVLAQGRHILWIPALNRSSACFYITENTKNVFCARVRKQFDSKERWTS